MTVLKKEELFLVAGGMLANGYSVSPLQTATGVKLPQPPVQGGPVKAPAGI